MASPAVVDERDRAPETSPGELLGGPWKTLIGAGPVNAPALPRGHRRGAALAYVFAADSMDDVAFVFEAYGD
jgi:hypothetical protein